MSGRSQTKHTKNRQSCVLFLVLFNPPLNSQRAELTFSLRYNCLLVKELRESEFPISEFGTVTQFTMSGKRKKFIFPKKIASHETLPQGQRDE
jgi:hypothetical protein